ncbi:VOC family protein [Pseudohoeflea coraliihabitans]|uniref:VOC family protein n=1 Tax=Pseudohoeflea coraliihabitans TaxID=2860393 RepID=A0ABS6WQP0_9HYPH|nr:VOC family protein [Pseudohoeflea sp. DP4N28-3]MBW3098286.1 VOC family protein [Pseudohoeflea sp. DP4N28-3]
MTENAKPDRSINGVNGMVVFTYTDDLAKGCRLWEQVLGLTCAVDQGVCRIYQTAPTAYVGVCTLSDRPRDPAGVTISLLADDVDAMAGKIIAAGYQVIFGPAYAEEFDVYTCIFLNDDGYRVEIQRFGR